MSSGGAGPIILKIKAALQAPVGNSGVKVWHVALAVTHVAAFIAGWVL